MSGRAGRAELCGEAVIQTYDPSSPTIRAAAKGDYGAFAAMELKDEGRQPVLVHGSTRTHERDCAFSPDGETLYYLSDLGDGTDVWRVRRADTNKLWSANVEFVRERIASGDICRRALSVSPDGRLLAWHDMTGRLTFADTNGTVRSVSSVASGRCESYVWSPDGNHVAATLCDGYGNADVWIVPAADGKPCNLSRNCKWDGTPAWSPDGRVVAFSGDRAATGDASYIFYAYLDPADEYHYERHIIGGGDNYFNNGAYRTAWTNYGRTIGNPLFFPKGTHAGTWDPAGVTLGVENNRIRAHHFALSGYLFQKAPYRLMLTYSRNYGLYRVPYTGESQWEKDPGTVKETPLRQVSMGLDVSVPLGNLFRRCPMSLVFGAYADKGSVLPDTSGMILGLKCEFR